MQDFIGIYVYSQGINKHAPPLPMSIIVYGDVQFSIWLLHMFQFRLLTQNEFCSVNLIGCSWRTWISNHITPHTYSIHTTWYQLWFSMWFNCDSICAMFFLSVVLLYKSKLTICCRLHTSPPWSLAQPQSSQSQQYNFNSEIHHRDLCKFNT